MNMQLAVTKKGSGWARKNAAALRKDIKCEVDNMTSDQLLVLWAQLGDKPTSKGKGAHNEQRSI
ncbi:hypothetical protein TFLX_04026 [Thermoflexales bacterium]|nr:hypothetical protein TFLX_04026 [Thermoflexales bacterium]